MKLVQCNKAEILGKRKRNKIIEMVEEFYNSNMEIAKVETKPGEYSDKTYLGTLIKDVVKRLGYDRSLNVFTVSKKVYISKVSPDE